MKNDRIIMFFNQERFNALMYMIDLCLRWMDRSNFEVVLEIEQLRDKIWRYSHFEENNNQVVIEFFPSEMRMLCDIFLFVFEVVCDAPKRMKLKIGKVVPNYFEIYPEKHEEYTYKPKLLSTAAIRQLINMFSIGYYWLVCNKDGKIYFVDHGIMPVEKIGDVWNNKEYDGYVVQAFEEEKRDVSKKLFHGRTRNLLILEHF